MGEKSTDGRDVSNGVDATHDGFDLRNSADRGGWEDVR
jgi:hypothetical protein